MLNVIGRCTIDENKIKAEMPQIIFDELRVKRKFWSYINENKENNSFFKTNYNTLSEIYDRVFRNVGHYNLTDEEHLNRYREDFNNVFDSWYDNIRLGNCIIKCYYIDDIFALIGFSETLSALILLPSSFVKVAEYKDYSAIQGDKRMSLMGQALDFKTDKNNNTITVAESRSQKQVLNEKEKAEEKKRILEAEIEDVKNAGSGKLAEMRAKIEQMQKKLEAEKQKQLDILNQRKAEMEEQLEKLETTIFRLDSEIYAIRCYTGEIIELKHLRKGKPAKEDTPLVFSQKLRYLDEELGKYVSLYNVDFSDIKNFETLLSTRDDMFELFAPSERSLMLVKVSKTGLSYQHGETHYNMLDIYEKYHGKKIGIILRDGENLYIAWTDDERIVFSGEAFYKPGEHESTPEEIKEYEKGSFETDKDYKKRIKQLKKKNVNEMLGRYFISVIMQGLIDKNFIKFPEKIKFADSPYIVKSYADGWLTSNQYGEFKDLIERCNSSIAKGDNIITVQSLRPLSPSSRCSIYCNDRGRGIANRTHDVSAEDCTIYPVNMVEHSATYEHKSTLLDGSKHTYTDVFTDDEVKIKKSNNAFNGYTKRPNSDTYSYYISLKKKWSYSGTSRANFQVFKDEFINLTFMNSVWLEYVITNQKTKDIRIGSAKVDFAHLLPYLKTALQFVRERETKVAEYIAAVDKTILDDKEWPVKLSEWMLENNVHNFSEFRAKQFVKDLFANSL